MQAAGTKRQKRRDHRGIAGKRPVRSEIIEGADFECPVQLYNTLPMYEDIDLEHIKEITKQRQRALNIIDCMLDYQSHIKKFLSGLRRLGGSRSNKRKARSKI